jgi:aminoglycoside phosphotransferase (APT) family kinase protein
MSREFKVLSLLHPIYPSAPIPILYCEDENIIGAPFYLMERVKGIILRSKPLEGIALTTDLMRTISESAIDNLAALHAIDVVKTGLITLGKPEGYVQRQVEGWTKRYYNSKTDNIENMDLIAKWMVSNMPITSSTGFIHNDYKYDNLVLNPRDPSMIIAVLDWEMATVGDPLMDLGTTLAYWAEENDNPALKPFNLTWLNGNMTRREVIERYALQSGRNTSNMLFYYVFGTFKIAVIVQQIYARFKKGHTKDARFASLIQVVKACADNGSKAMSSGQVSSK